MKYPIVATMPYTYYAFYFQHYQKSLLFLTFFGHFLDTFFFDTFFGSILTKTKQNNTCAILALFSTV